MSAAAYAELLVDTARRASLSGCRGGVADRQLVFRRDGMQLDVMLQPVAPATTFVWGRLCRVGTWLPCENAAVALIADAAGPVAESATDAFGEFSFAAPRIVAGDLAVAAPGACFLCRLAPPVATPTCGAGSRA